jgi:hypothetical protein
MWYDEVFRRFVEQSPFCVMLRATLEHLFADSFLDDLFAQQAQVQYHRELAFSTVASLLSQVVLRVHPSVRSAYRKRPDVPVTLKAVYEKLQRVEPAVCQALVRAVADRAADVLACWPAARHPDPVPGLRLRVVDGNYLAGTDRRLRELRGQGAAALPGMAVGLRDDRTGLLTDVLLREDAYTNERALTDELLARLGPDDLLLGDRNFCSLDLLRGAAARRAYVTVRHHRQLHLHPTGPLRHVGTTATGEVYEQPVRVGEGDEALALRCVVIKLFAPTREGESEVVLLSSVPADKADAVALAELYLRRWTIEGAWQEMTDQLRCEVDTLGYPKAALFGFSLAAVAYNLLAVLKGALAAEHGPAKVEQELSSHAVAEEVALDYSGMRVALPAECWQRFGQMGSAELAAWLRQTARGIRWDRYRKSKRGPKKPVQVKRTRRGAHRSTARLLQNREKSSQ